MRQFTRALNTSSLWSIGDRRLRATGALIGMVAIAAVAVSCFFVSDSDLFMHLKNGERILNSGRLERAEVYSYTTTESEFPNHEWLSNLIGALIWRAGGFELLVLLKAVAVGVIVLMLAASSRLRGARGLAVPCTLLVFVVLVRFRLYTRPEIFSLLLLPVVDLLCLDAVVWPPSRRIWLIPFLTAVWANLHPGVVLAPVIVGTHGVGALLAGRLPLLASRGTPRDGRRLLLVALSCLPAMSLTPYGVGIFTPLFRIATSDAIRAAAVREWLPPGFGDFSFFYLTLGVCSVLLVVFRRRIAAADLALWFGFAALALRSLRHVGVFAVVGAPVLAVAATLTASTAGRFFARVAPTLARWLRPGARAAVVGSLIIAVALALLSPRASILHQDQSRHYRFGLGLDNLSAPIATVDLLEQWALPGPLYNSWEFGGYLMWRVWPRLQVFLDGRDYMYEDLIRELQRTPFEQVLAARGIRALLIAHDDLRALEVTARLPGFALLAFDDRAQLWLSRETLEVLPDVEPLEQLRPQDLSLAWFDRLPQAQQEEAERSAQRAVERAPGHARPWALLGQIQRRRGDLDLAIRSYERAVSLDRGQASYANNLGACLLDRGFPEQAEAQFLAATRFDPKILSAHLNLGRARLQLGDPDGAVKALNRARRLAPGEAETIYLLGVATPDPQVAEDYFQRYLMMDPDGRWAAEARRRLSVD